MLTLFEALKVAKAINDLERQQPKDQQSAAVLHAARLTADVLIDRQDRQK